MGAETVRAFLYLRALMRDYPTEQANALSVSSLLTMNPGVLQGIIEEIQTVHGKQMPLIAEAYRRGMQPMLPGWYQSIVVNAPSLASIDAVYSTPLSMRDRKECSPSTIPLEPLKADAPSIAEAVGTFELYYGRFLQEVKRLSGQTEGDLHVIELMEDEPLRRAYLDGVSPEALAFIIHKESAQNHRA